MRLLVSWLRDFVDVDASPEEIAERVGLRGFEVASVEPWGEGDAVIDFEVTANRPDCLSVVGLAREVATIYDRPMVLPSSLPDAAIALAPLAAGTSERVRITIEDAVLCPRYTAAVADVTVGASPAWMSRRLQAAGIRPISSIVDLTNYVLIELGQPMHAFDLARLAGPEIRVRRAVDGEQLTTLDGVARTLSADTLVIADRDRPQAVAGVMGGAAAEVTAATRTVLFESAYFAPASIRRTGKRLNLRTEASARFERGADISATLPALARLAALMERIGAGHMVGQAVDVYPTPREPGSIHLRRARLALVLGVTVSDASVSRILASLGLLVRPVSDGWDVTVPTFRVDLLREIDLIEEVGRHDGFERLADTFPVVTAPAPPPDPRIPRDRLVRRVLTGAGLSEAVTFGFIEARTAARFAEAVPRETVSIENPLSAKFDTLRPSLVPGLVDAVAHNRRHGRDDVRLFEIGTRFRAEGEVRAVAAAWTGAATVPHWSGPARRVDFFDAKGVVETLCRTLDVPVRFERTRQPFLVPGHAAVVIAADGAGAGTHLGLLGRITSTVADASGLPPHDHVYVAELDLDAIERLRPRAREGTAPLPRFPFVVRDLSIVVPATLPAAIIRDTILAAGHHGPAPLVAVAFFDRYQGKGVPDDAISLSVRLTFQAADRTLTDADVQHSVDGVLAALVRDHQAVQR